jgi:hypothetical protein
MRLSGPLKVAIGATTWTVTVYRFQLKSRTKPACESLQDFATAIKRLIHQALAGLSEHYICIKSGYAFINGIRYQDTKQQLLMGVERTPSETFSQALQLEAAKMADGTPVRF